MGIFNRRDKLDDITPEVDDVLLQALLTNESITRDKAMTLPAVSGDVDFICNCVASIPVKLYKKEDGKVTEVDDQRVGLLNLDTRDTLDGFQFKKAMVEDYLLGKGGYCFIERLRNDVTGLYYVEEKHVHINRSIDHVRKDYDIEVDSKKYKKHEFIKLLRNTKDGASGVGVVTEVSKLLETAYQTLLFQLNIVKTGGNKKGFLKSVSKLDDDTITKLKEAWRRLYGNNQENVVVLNKGLEFQEASNTAAETQLNESKTTLSTEIHNLFHISGDFEQTFKFAIFPILQAFQTALNRDLLLREEREKGYFFEFDSWELVKASLSERFNAYKTAKDAGFIGINEIRAKEKLNHIEGMDVINVGLGSALYDMNTHTYYVPNTSEQAKLG